MMNGPRRQRSLHAPAVFIAFLCPAAAGEKIDIAGVEIARCQPGERKVADEAACSFDVEAIAWQRRNRMLSALLQVIEPSVEIDAHRLAVGIRDALALDRLGHFRGVSLRLLG